MYVLHSYTLSLRQLRTRIIATNCGKNVIKEKVLEIKKSIRRSMFLFQIFNRASRLSVANYFYMRCRYRNYNKAM